MPQVVKVLIWLAPKMERSCASAHSALAAEGLVFTADHFRSLEVRHVRMAADTITRDYADAILNCELGLPAWFRSSNRSWQRFSLSCPGNSRFGVERRPTVEVRKQQLPRRS